MMLLFYRIFAVVALLGIVVILGVLIRFKFLRTEYLYHYQRDHILRTYKVKKNVFDMVYRTKNETGQYIPEYILSKNKKKKYFICNYAEQYQEISFFLYTFDSQLRMKKIMKIKEKNNALTSKMIRLPKKCNSVNILIHTVDGLCINKFAIRRVPRRRIFMFSLLWGLIVFCLLFALRHAIVEYFGSVQKEIFFNSVEGYWSLLACLAVAVLVWLSFMVILSFKNKYIFKKRGAKYEF